jgi:mono/diheme cytochrome c family protein
LGRLVAVEATVAVLIVLAVGVLTSLEPARQVASREGIGVADELKFSDTAEGIEIQLTVAPGQVGQNRFVVGLEDRLGNSLIDAEEVSIDLTSLDVDLGKTTLVARNLGDGRYAIDDGLFSVAGAWQAAVVVRRSDAFDARTAFRFIAAKTSASGSAVIAPDPDKGQFLLGLEIFGGAVLFMGVGVAAGGWWTRRGASLLGPGLAGAVIGVVLAASSPIAESGFDTRTNPFPPDHASLDTGEQLYVSNCQVCHGASGLGDGPGSEGLDPPPADLVVHVPLHPDPDLFDIISDGVSGSAMSPFREALTEDEVWHLINYIQTLE